MDFTEILQSLNTERNQFTEDLAAQLAQCVDSVRDRPGSKATMTLKLILESASDDPVRVTVSGEISAKLPIGGAGRSLLYAVGNGELDLADPRQDDVENYTPSVTMIARGGKPKGTKVN